MATEQDQFSSRLIKARSAKGWSQLDLSNACGVAAAQISRYEQGTNTPRPQVVAKLASALGVAFSWLLTGAGEPVDQWRAGRTTLRVELPSELVRQIERAAIVSRRLVDEEVQVRLEASFRVYADAEFHAGGRSEVRVGTTSQPATGDIESGRVTETTITMDHLREVAREAAERVAQTMLRMEGLDVVRSGQATAVVTRPDGSIAPFEPPQAPLAPPPASKGPTRSPNSKKPVAK